MSNDTNMDNRVLAEFMGYTPTDLDELDIVVCHYHQSYDWLMPVWEKFRELRFEESSIEHCRYTREHADHCAKIGKAMIHGTLTDLYNALVQAVKWYNEVTKQKK